MLFNHRVHRYVVSRPRRRQDEEIVQSGLAFTPSQMLEMANQGIPISVQNAGLSYEDGFGKLDFEPPINYRRGVDIGDLWEAQENAKMKFRKLRDAGKFVQSTGESAL